MDDREFFDHLYQLWSKTTNAAGSYWMPQEYVDGTGRWKLYAVEPPEEEGEEPKKTLIASELREVDADFISGIHGCVADLVRRLNDALDEADRADYDRDERECRLAELEMEVQELKELARTWGAPV